jgi:(p)ppGpp synthase/HD superfamily hydrolase
MWNQDVYQKAIAFAGLAHRNQLVPSKEYNYVVHISNVAAEVARAMFEEDIGDSDLIIQCALLHDVLEDTDVTQEQVKDTFGEKVLAGVFALTKNSNLDKKDRMSDSISRIKKQGKEIACVKMADRITNLQKPPSKWSKEKIGSYLEEAIIIHEELGYASKYLGDRLKQKIEEYRQYL